MKRQEYEVENAATMATKSIKFATIASAIAIAADARTVVV
jgi:hypothetical protein